MEDILVREEKLSDCETIHWVEAEAFDRTEEADLVDALRSRGVLALSLVAEIDGSVVGHIAFSPATIVGEEGTVEAAALPRLRSRRSTRTRVLAPRWSAKVFGCIENPVTESSS